MTNLNRVILVTGPSGIGKTSVIRRSIKELKAKKYRVGGVMCHEVREGGIRVGFEIIDLATEMRGWLAHIYQPTGPIVGKYRVNMIDLDIVGAGSLSSALSNADIIAIDEIGPMELFSAAFREALVRVIESSKPVVGSIHYRLSNSLVDNIRQRHDVEIIKVTRENREHLHNLVVKLVTKNLI